MKILLKYRKERKKNKEKLMHKRKQITNGEKKNSATKNLIW